MSQKSKIIRITTVPASMNVILKGQLGWMNQYYEIVGVTGQDEKHFPDLIKREGIRMIPVFMARNISILKDLISVWTLFRIFRKEKPDIVHTHTPKAGLAGMIAAFLAGVPVRLHTVGGIPWMEIRGIKRKILKTTERLTYRLADRVYPNSTGLKKFIIEEGLDRSVSIKVLGKGSSNGINTDFFASDFEPGIREKMRQSQGIASHDIVLGYVGRVAREKGIGEWIEAFDRLRTTYPVKMVLIGLFEREYGGLNEFLEYKINNDPDIQFLGRFDDVRPYYALMDIFVFPSYREGFPNALLEACAMGLPVVATDINGCNEIVEDGISGLLIPPKSSEDLYLALKRLVEDPDLRNRLGNAARAHVADNFEREVIWKALHDEYEFFLQKKLEIKFPLTKA